MAVSIWANLTDCTANLINTGDYTMNQFTDRKSVQNIPEALLPQVRSKLAAVIDLVGRDSQVSREVCGLLVAATDEIDRRITAAEYRACAYRVANEIAESLLSDGEDDWFTEVPADVQLRHLL
jgi:hypothetical protein